jgi:site-specific DNA-methyltransferase (adenine-specific)
LISNKNDIENITNMESRKKSFVLFSYEVEKIKLLENEYIINYQYYDGDYSWIMIVNKEEIIRIGENIKKNLLTGTLINLETKVIRLTKVRNLKIANEFGYKIDDFDTLFELYKTHENKSTIEYLKLIDIIDNEHTGLYDTNNVINKQLSNGNECDIMKIVKYNELDNSKMNDSLISIKEDCIKGIQYIKDKSIQTICIDPPYNIGKDTWDNIDNYNEWLTNVVVDLEKKLRDNGSMFIFHNDMEAISELMVSIKKHTKLKFIQMITWNKRYEGSKKKGFLDGYVVKKSAHKWELMAEYILFYTFDNTWKYKEARLQNKICSKEIQKEVPSKTGGMTGWYGNIETGLNFPTRERMVPITKHTGLKYEDVVPKFINQKTHHSVWNYDSAKKNKKCSHVTPKPINLLENLIKHTTDEGDILLDCFAGTGSLGKACLNTNRKCILIEREEEYINFINEELFD